MREKRTRRGNRQTVPAHIHRTPRPTNTVLTAGLLARGSSLSSGLPDAETSVALTMKARRLQLRGQRRNWLAVSRTGFPLSSRYRYPKNHEPLELVPPCRTRQVRPRVSDNYPNDACLRPICSLNVLFLEGLKNAAEDLATPQEQTGKGASLRATRAPEAGQIWPVAPRAWKPGRLKRRCSLVGLEEALLGPAG